MHDRVVLITGATGGLGPAVAATFAADGARFALAASHPERLDRLAADLVLADDRWMPIVADLRDLDATRGAVAEVTDRFGKVDVLLHLVGGWAGGTAVVDLERADVAAMLDPHLWMTLNATRSVLPGMVERGWGRIVAVSSPFAMNPGAKGASYAIAKAAEETLIRTIAREVASTGVTANVLVIKAIDTAHARESEPTPKNASWTTPEEIAATMRFLCSDEAGAINGARIALDGRG
jgi:NAD(P)-dependent dehydrogenase (short-subunit alcohol dehydrogenase family)